MIPYWEIESWVLVPGGPGRLLPWDLAFRPFGVLVACGIVAALVIGLVRARRAGLRGDRFVSFSATLLVSGFCGAHIGHELLYRTDAAPGQPWFVLNLDGGLSSFGGFAAAVLAAWLWQRVTREPWLPYADAVASAFPLGWALGRTGCFVAHDHPGLESTSVLAVAYPGGARFDLGLLEALALLPLFAWTSYRWRRSPPRGRILGEVCGYYALLRFGLDFLRVHAPLAGVFEPRWYGLTPAQWLSVPLFAAGLVLWVSARADGVVRAHGALAPVRSERPPV